MTHLNTEAFTLNDNIFFQDEDTRQPLLSPMTPPSSNFPHDVTLLEDGSYVRHYLGSESSSLRQGPTSSGTTTAGTLRGLGHHRDASLLSSPPGGVDHGAPQSALNDTSPSAVARKHTSFMTAAIPVLERRSPARSLRSTINYHIPQLFGSHAVPDEFVYHPPKYGYHWFSETALNGMDRATREEWASLYKIDAYPKGEPDTSLLILYEGREIRVYAIEFGLPTSAAS
ncbi:hypothetical protein BDZ89DRAFT_1126461 [Hymenopellis radicata]|nr:hypothetical protein BDZ89DRAFT_1126461 [Hymenopellis radicata]